MDVSPDHSVLLHIPYLVSQGYKEIALLHVAMSMSIECKERMNVFTKPGSRIRLCDCSLPKKVSQHCLVSHGS